MYGSNMDGSAFSVDLRDGGGAGGMGKVLTLYGLPPARAAVVQMAHTPAAERAQSDGNMRMLLPPRDAILLVCDLNRKYGNWTVH